MDDKIYTFYTLRSSDEPERVRYVGVTSSTLKKRFQGHKGEARGKHRSQPVHHWMYKKYQEGLDIICEELDKCSESEWKEREKYWVSYYRKIEPELLNLQDGGSGVYTADMRSIEGMERTRLASIKPVAAYDDNDNLIAKFDSLSEAARHFNISKGNIGCVLKGKKKHCGGYKWKYLEKEELDINKYRKKVNPDYNKRIIVYKFDKNNNLLQTYQSARQVMRDVFGEDTTFSGDYFVKKILDKNKLWYDCYWSTSENYIINDTNYTCKEISPDGKIVDLFRTIKDVERKFECTYDKVKYRMDKHKPMDNGNFIVKY